MMSDVFLKTFETFLLTFSYFSFDSSIICSSNGFLSFNRFDPDRFSEKNKKNRHPYAFQPFGFAGKRKCPGYKYAYLESVVVLATVLRR